MKTTPADKLKRADWDEYFMNIAQVISSRSTCDRKFVGAVIVRDKTILSTGYNGSIRKLEHCSEVGHMMENDHCVGTIHAEANAIIQAAKNGVCIDGATIYTTASPCWLCFKLIANSGLKRICFGEFYRDERIFTVAKKLKMDLTKLEKDEITPSLFFKSRRFVNLPGANSSAASAINVVRRNKKRDGVTMKKKVSSVNGKH